MTIPSICVDYDDIMPLNLTDLFVGSGFLNVLTLGVCLCLFVRVLLFSFRFVSLHQFPTNWVMWCKMCDKTHAIRLNKAHQQTLSFPRSTYSLRATPRNWPRTINIIVCHFHVTWWLYDLVFGLEYINPANDTSSHTHTHTPAKLIIVSTIGSLVAV